MKIFYTTTSFILLFLVITVKAQYTELVLDPANVFAPPPHYDGTNGTNQSDPAALVNDTFNYNPNEPEVEFPVQGWKSDPEFSYYFPAYERIAENDPTNPTFPIIDTDSNWIGVRFEIPEGMEIAAFDCWGQDHIGSTHNSQDLVFILKNGDNHRWYYLNWDGIQSFGSPSRGYARFDFGNIGVTDNLLKNATELVITRIPRQGYNEWLRIAELRIVLQPDPNIDDDTPPILSNVTSGNIYNIFEVSGTCNERSTIYVVPKGPYETPNEVIDSAKIKVACLADSTFSFSDDELSTGTYNIIAIDGGYNLSTLSEDIIYTEQPPNTEADITSVEFLNSYAISTIIDNQNDSIHILLEEGSDAENLFTVIELSQGANSTFISSEFYNFGDPFSITVTAEDGITNKEWIIMVDVEEELINSLPDLNNELRFKLYPNPISEVLYIDTDEEQYKVQIYSSGGNLIKEYINTHKIRTSHFKPGLYYIQCIFKDFSITKKMIKLQD